MTAHEARAMLARGRRLGRLAGWGIGGGGAVLPLLIGAGLLALHLGWWADSDATPAVVGLPIVGLCTVTSLVVAWRGRRLAKAAFPTVIANPDPQIPDRLHFGLSRPGLQAAVILAVATIGAAVMPLLAVGAVRLICGEACTRRRSATEAAA